MSPRRFALLVMAAVILVQAAWIMAVPPYRGIDEFDHAYRADAVAHGEWFAGGYPAEGRGYLVTVRRDIVEAASGQCASLNYTGPDNCFPAGRAGPGMVLVGSGAGGYNPLFYWVVGTAGRPFHGAGALYAMRSVAALLCAVLIGLAAWCAAAARRSGWMRYGMLVAITPVVLFTTIMPAANGAEIAAGLLAWTALLSLPRLEDPGRERVALVLAIVGCVLLAGLRKLGPGYVVLIWVGIAWLNGTELRAVLRRHRSMAAVGVALCVAAVLGQFAWTLLWQSPSGPPPEFETIGSAVSHEHGLHWWALGWVLYPMQTIAAFPFRDQAGPGFVYPLYLAVFVGLLVAGLRRADSRLRKVLLTLCGVVWVLPYVLNLLSEAVGGEPIWQGRYGLALSVGIPLLAGLGLSLRCTPVAAPARVLGIAGGAAVLLAHGASIVKVLRDEGARAVSANDPGWIQPPAWVLVIVLVAAAACVASAASATASVPVEEPAVSPAHHR